MDKSGQVQTSKRAARRVSIVEYNTVKNQIATSDCDKLSQVFKNTWSKSMKTVQDKMSKIMPSSIIGQAKHVKKRR